MSTEPVWCSLVFPWGVLLLVAPAYQSGSSRATLYDVEDTVSTLGDIMRTSGDVQYIVGLS